MKLARSRDMTMTGYRFVLLGVGLLALFGAATSGWAQKEGDMWDFPATLAVSRSPRGLGTASFLRESTLNENTTYFFVRAPQHGGNQPLFVDGPYSREIGVKMKDAVWSKDGSVVAVRAAVNEAAGHQSRKLRGTFYVAAYDFRAHKAVGAGLEVWPKAVTIQKLLAQHGGCGRVMPAQPYTAWHVISEKQHQLYKYPR